MNKNKATKRKKRGIGSVYFDNTHNCYAGQTTVDLGNGRRKRLTVYAKTEREACRKLNELNLKSEKGEYVEKNNITLKDFAENLIQYELDLNNIKEATAKRKLETLKTLQPIYDIPIQNFKEDDIKDFLVHHMMNYSQSSINKTFQLLKKVFDEAKHKKLIVDNIMDFIKCPKTKADYINVRGFTLDEERKFINALKLSNVLYKEVMLLMLFTGARAGEITALDIEDIDFDKRMINIHKTVSKSLNNETIIHNQTKTKAGMRQIYMTDDVVAFLKALIGDRTEGLLFVSKKGGIVSTQSVYSQFRKVIDNYDIIDKKVSGKIDLHSLRHTFSNRCYESNMPAKSHQAVMGHSDITITLGTYVDKPNIADPVKHLNQYQCDNGISMQNFI